MCIFLCAALHALGYFGKEQRRKLILLLFLHQITSWIESNTLGQEQTGIIRMTTPSHFEAFYLCLLISSIQIQLELETQWKYCCNTKKMMQDKSTLQMLQLKAAFHCSLKSNSIHIKEN